MGTIQVTPGEPGQLIIRFPYSPERVTAVRAVPGRRWHPEEKYWTVPHSPETLKRIHALFAGDRVVVAASVKASTPELPITQVQEIVTALDGELTLRQYSPKTRDDYRLQVQRFLRWLRRDPAEAANKDLQAYLLDLLDSELSASYVRQARAALGILYRSVLGSRKRSRTFPKPREETAPGIESSCFRGEHPVHTYLRAPLDVPSVAPERMGASPLKRLFTLCATHSLHICWKMAWT